MQSADKNVPQSRHCMVCVLTSSPQMRSACLAETVNVLTSAGGGGFPRSVLRWCHLAPGRAVVLLSDNPSVLLEVVADSFLCVSRASWPGSRPGPLTAQALGILGLVLCCWLVSSKNHIFIYYHLAVFHPVIEQRLLSFPRPRISPDVLSVSSRDLPCSVFSVRGLGPLFLSLKTLTRGDCLTICLSFHRIIRTHRVLGRA